MRFLRHRILRALQILDACATLPGCSKACSAFPQTIQRSAARKLDMLAAAVTLESLRVPPSNRLEQMTGERSGQYSIRINDQWRVCFRWQDGDAYDV